MSKLNVKITTSAGKMVVGGEYPYSATLWATFAQIGGEWSRRNLDWSFPMAAQQQVLDLLNTEYGYVPAAAPVAAARPAYKPFAQQTRRERLHTELESIRRPSYSDDANGGNGSVMNDAARTNHWSR